MVDLHLDGDRTLVAAVDAGDRAAMTTSIRVAIGPPCTAPAGLRCSSPAVSVARAAPGHYVRVASAIGLREAPPEGLIVHTAGATPDGGFRVLDVWESRDHIEAFFAERLMPLMGAVLGDPP